jgi:hypothetical protein
MVRWWRHSTKVMASNGGIQDLDSGRWALETPFLISTSSNYLSLSFPVPGRKTQSCNYSLVVGSSSLHGSWYDPHGVWTSFLSFSRFSALSYLTSPLEQPGCRRSLSKSHSITGTAWHHVTSDVYLNVYSLTWIKQEQSRGVLCCWLLVLVTIGCMIEVQGRWHCFLSACVGKGRCPHCSLCSLAPALKKQLILWN